MVALAFVDTETTGLDPGRHQVWEVGLILRTDVGEDHEYQWQMRPDLNRAEAVALKIGRFYERRDTERAVGYHQFATEFGELSFGAYLVGAVPSFDDAFLKDLLRHYGACPGWHYHLVDVEALAAGQLAMEPPWDSEELSKAVGVDPEKFDRHTALGDARWARAVYDAVVTSR